MSIPLFPSLTPKIVDPLWFSIDKPRNDESELVQQEQEHQTWKCRGKTRKYNKATHQLNGRRDSAITLSTRPLDFDLCLRLNSIGQRDCDLAPIGKTASECQDEEEEDEEEDDNDDDESDTHDEEDEDVDMELSYEVSDNRQMAPPADSSV
ncbi:hypothetical protein J6590_067188 [Homalodisca vitripennis]|nr:hypothetical protein J6590_067188 [Homalodisca vitripennis]